MQAWSMGIISFSSIDCEIELRPGKENVVADALSRAPVPEKKEDPENLR